MKKKRIKTIKVWNYRLKQYQFIKVNEKIYKDILPGKRD